MLFFVLIIYSLLFFPQPLQAGFRNLENNCQTTLLSGHEASFEPFKTIKSVFGADPETLVRRADITVSEADIINEFNTLKGLVDSKIMEPETFWVNKNSELELSLEIKREAWNQLVSPISVKVRDFFYSDDRFLKDFPNGRSFKMELKITKMKVGDYADNHMERGFHIDGGDVNSRGIFHPTPGQSLYQQQYIFNLNSGVGNVAPTEIFIGCEGKNIDTHIERAITGKFNAPGTNDVILPSQSNAVTYLLENGELARFSTNTLHRRTAAIRTGWRYFIRVFVK